MRSLILAVLVLSTPAVAQERATDLSKPFQVQTGDFLALQLGQLFAVAKPVDIPVFFLYDRAAKRIVATAFGSRTSIDGAREVVEELRPLIERAAASYGAPLSDDTLTIVYRNREKDKEVVRREAGKFLSP